MAPRKAKAQSGAISKKHAETHTTPANERSPFEMVSGKQKLAPLGASTRGVQGNWARSRANAYYKREQSIKPQLLRERSNNAFIDRRIGAGGGADQPGSAEAESKRLKRLERVRKKQLAGTRKHRFNISDDADEDGETLTHMGRSLTELEDDLNDQDHLEVDGEDEEQDALFTKRTWRSDDAAAAVDKAPSDTDASNRPKSKKEKWQEMIAKSKEERAQKQREKEEEKDQVSALDESFKQLQERGVELPLRHKQPPFLKGKTDESKKAEAESNALQNDFDVLAREVLSDSRGQATERTLTEEEAETLRQREMDELERKRLKRAERLTTMDDGEKYADDADDSNACDNDENAPQGGFALRRYKKRKRQEESSGEAEKQKSGHKKQKVQERTTNDELLDAAEGQYEGDESGDEDASDDSEHQEADEGDGSEEEEEEHNRFHSARPDLQQGIELLRQKGVLDKYGVEHEFFPSSSKADEDRKHSRTEERERKEQRGRSEIDKNESDNRSEPSASPHDEGSAPHEHQLPQSYNDLQNMLANAGAGEVREILSKLIAANPPGKSVERRKALQTFFALVLRHFEDVAGGKQTSAAAADAYVPPLLELTTRFPYFATLSCKERLRKMHDGLRERLSKHSGKQWPHPRTFLLLRLFHILFPASDFRHPVLTPASILIGEMLALCPVTNSREAALAVYCCDLAREVVSANERHFPEALDMLAALIRSGYEPSTASSTPGHVAHRMKAAVLQTKFAARKSSTSRLPLLDLLHCRGIAAPGKRRELKARTLTAALRSAHGFASACSTIQASPEMFQPLLDAVRGLGSIEALPASMEAERARADSELSEAVGRAKIRPTVQLMPKTTKEIPMYNPKFIEGGIEPNRDNDIDRSKAERRKLLRQHKKEKRGAKRELRKDNRYLAMLRESERAQNDQRRLASERSFYSTLQAQERDMKSGGTSGQWLGGPKDSAPVNAGKDKGNKRK